MESNRIESVSEFARVGERGGYLEGEMKKKKVFMGPKVFHPLKNKWVRLDYLLLKVIVDLPCGLVLLAVGAYSLPNVEILSEKEQR